MEYSKDLKQKLWDDKIKEKKSNKLDLKKKMKKK